jgi:uncharacterized protein YegJ (DUF2314 family)
MRFTALTLALAIAAATAQQPPDKPAVGVGKAYQDALIKAEEPYIEKGRATYPAAKTRFLAGLPRGYAFQVRKRLRDAGSTDFEEVFVHVDAINDGVVHGRILNKLEAVHSFHQGQQISFPESEVLDWTIVHPDGQEEGNYVGKFLDTYNPH